MELFLLSIMAISLATESFLMEVSMTKFALDEITSSP